MSSKVWTFEGKVMWKDKSVARVFFTVYTECDLANWGSLLEDWLCQWYVDVKIDHDTIKCVTEEEADQARKKYRKQNWTTATIQ